MRRRVPGGGLPLGPTGLFMVARVVALGAGLVAVLISARLFGAEGRGVLAAFAVLQFLGATGLAFGSGSGAFLAAHRGTQAIGDVANGLLAQAAALGLLIATLAGLAWMANLWVVAVPGTSLGVAIALGPAVAGQYLILGWSQAAMGAGATGRAALGWILGPALMLASVGVAGIARLAVSEFLILQSAGWMLTGLGFVVVGGGRWPSLRSARDIVRLGRGAALGDLTNALSYRLDVLLVVWLAGSAAAGVYSLATQLMEPLWLLATSAAGGLLIAFRDQNERARGVSTVRAGWQVAVLTTAGAIGVVAVLPLVSALAGPGFEGALQIGAVLAPGIVFLAVAKIFAAYQISLGRLWLGSVIATLAVAVAILGGFILIPRFGAVGAAAAASVSYGVAFLLWLAAFRGAPRADAGAYPPGDDRTRAVL